jgi:glycogen synthase
VTVLHVTSEYPPVHFGGLGTAVDGLTRALVEAGTAVCILLVHGAGAYGYGYGYGHGYSYGRGRAESPGEAPPGTELVHLSYADALREGPALAASRAARILHLHSSWLWAVADAIRAATGIPTVYTAHSIDRAEIEHGEWLPHGSIQDRAIDEADRVIVLSRSERVLVERHHPSALARTRIVGNGLDPPSGGTVRRPRGAAVVLYVGRFGTRKAVGDVFEAVPLVRARIPAARFLFVGGGSPEDGPREAAAWVPARLRDHLDRMAFRGWCESRPPRDADWYGLADVLVVPSRYEPFGMVVLEGMLRGKAVLAADGGGPAELLEHERTGLLYPPGDVDAMAAALCRALGDAGLRRRLGRAARIEARRHWSWTAVLPALLNVYAELVSPSDSGRPRT